MIHKDRSFLVTGVPTAADLAERLTEHDWTGCTGFVIAGRPDLLFLNDSFGGGTAEYAIVRVEGSPDAPVYRQIETVTFGWMKRERAEEYLRGVLDGTEEMGMGSIIQVDVTNHGKTCYACA